MASTDLDLDTAVKALTVLEELITQQRKKVREAARRVRPDLRDQDLDDLQGLADVHRDPAFQYEDGQLAGLIAAHLTIKARLVGATTAQG